MVSLLWVYVFFGTTYIVQHGLSSSVWIFGNIKQILIYSSYAVLGGIELFHVALYITILSMFVLWVAWVKKIYDMWCMAAYNGLCSTIRTLFCLFCVSVCVFVCWAMLSRYAYNSIPAQSMNWAIFWIFLSMCKAELYRRYISRKFLCFKSGSNRDRLTDERFPI